MESNISSAASCLTVDTICFELTPSWFSLNNSKMVKAVTPGILQHSVIFD